LPLPFLTFRIARALGASSSGAAAAAFLPAALPQLTHVAGAVSNDTLTVTLGAAVTWLAIEVTRRRRARRWALALGLTTSGLLLTKGIALPMLVVVLVAFLLRAGRFGPRRTIGDAVLALVCMLPGLAWWVANVVRFGTLQPDGYPKSYVDLLPKGHIGFGTWLHGFFPAMARSFFADFGWLEAPPPTALTGALSVVVLTLVAVGVLRSRDRLGETLLAQLSWIMPLIAIMDTSHAASARTGALQGVQGRYLFVGVAAVSATIVLALRADREPALGAGAGRAVSSWPYIALPLIAAVVAGLGLVAGISHFYAGDGLLAKIGTFTSWSPLRLRYLAPIAAIGMLAAIAGAVAISRGDSSDKSRSTFSSLRPGETVIR
jgi:4-amino-4-deoxy-L-arabinose transferase-like glycosyltransferase